MASHEWSKFEENALLSLMIKSVHINKLDKEKHSRKKRYLDISTALNAACHKGQYAKDIPWKDVADKVDEWIHDNKHGVAFMERSRVPHMTRALKLAWARNIKFTGSVHEWKNGREKLVLEEERNRRENPSSGNWDSSDAPAQGGIEVVDEGWGEPSKFAHISS